MAQSSVDRPPDKKEASPWPADIPDEFECESKNPNPCVGTTSLSENERTRVWIIRLAPAERLGFHRHVLDYFWVAISSSRARACAGRHDGRMDLPAQRDTARQGRQGRIHSSRSGKYRRSRDGLRDCRVQRKCQYGNGAAVWRNAALRGPSSATRMSALGQKQTTE